MDEKKYGINGSQSPEITEEDIRRSAESLKVPVHLKPENLEWLLEAKQKERNMYSSRWRKPGLVLGCVLLTLFCIIGIGYGHTTTNFTNQWQDCVPSRDFAAAEGAEESENQEESEFFRTAEDYEEIYEAVYSRRSEENTMDYGGSNSEDSVKSEASSESSGASQDTGAGSGATEYSDTNVRTQGVDEADIIKTDGNYIYTLTGSRQLNISKVEKGKMELISETELEDYQDIAREMYVIGDELYIIASRNTAQVRTSGEDMTAVFNEDTTVVYIYDMKDRSRLKKKKTAEQSGTYQTSRCTEGYLYLFSEYYPQTEAVSSIDDKNSFIPVIENDLLKAEDIVIPKEDYGQNYLVVSALNLESGKMEAQKAVLMTDNLYYVSQENFYICARRYDDQGGGTNLLRLSYDKGKIRTEQAGYIRGYIPDSFCIDEYNGYLRIVCSEVNDNTLYVLNMDMQVVADIRDIAEGEVLKSARFMGDTGYFVTYEQVDPLFSVDLKNPEKPEILGQLKVTGFSEYLHHFGENRLLGIGWETDPKTGSRMGLKLSMFDTSDPGKMKEIHKLVIENAEGCPGLDNYKAILADSAQKLIGLGISGYDVKRSASMQMYIAFIYDEEKGFQSVLSEDLDKWKEYAWGYNADQTRGLYVGNTFYLCSRQGILAYDRENGYENIGSLEW